MDVTLGQLRQKYPGRTDDELIRAAGQTEGINLIDEGPLNIGPAVESPTTQVPTQQPKAQPKQDDYDFFSYQGLKDINIDALKGIIGLGEGAVGLIDLVTPGNLGKSVQDLLQRQFGGNTEDALRWLQSLKSDEKLALEKKFSEVGGTDTLGDVYDKIKYLVEKPELIPGIIAESGPSMYGGAKLGQLFNWATKSVAPIAGIGLGEGAISAGISEEQIRQASPGGVTSAEQDAIAAASGVLTSVFGAAGAKIAQRLGLVDFDMFAAGLDKTVKKNMIIQAAGSAFLESAEEFPQSMQERAAYNLATGRPYLEGVFDDAAVGAVAGFGMGMGSGLVSSMRAEQVTNEQKKLDKDIEEDTDTIETEGSKQTKQKAKEGLIPKDLAALLDLKKENIEVAEPIKIEEAKPAEAALPDIGDTIEWQIDEKGNTATGKIAQKIPGYNNYPIGYVMESDGFGLGELVPVTRIKNLTQETQDVRKPIQQQDDGTSDELPSGEFGRDAGGTIQLDGTGVVSGEVSDEPSTGRKKRKPIALEDAVKQEVKEESIKITTPDGYEYFEEIDPNTGRLTSGYRLITEPKFEGQPAVIPDDTFIIENDDESAIRKITAPQGLSKDERQFYKAETYDSKKILKRKNTPRKFEAPMMSKKNEELEYLYIGSRYTDLSPEQMASSTEQTRQIGIAHAAYDSAMEVSDTVDIEELNKELKGILTKKKEARKKARAREEIKLKKEGFTPAEAKKEAERLYGTDKKIDSVYSVTNPIKTIGPKNFSRLFKKYAGKKSRPKRSEEAELVFLNKEKFVEDLNPQEKTIFDNLKNRFISDEAKAKKYKEGLKLGVKTKTRKVPEDPFAEETADELEAIEASIAVEKENEKVRKENVKREEPEVVFVKDVAKTKINALIKRNASFTEILDEIKYKGRDLAVAVIGPDAAYELSAKLLSDVAKKFNVNTKIRYGATIKNKPAQFNPETNEIVLNRPKLEGYDLREVIVHESVHAMLDHMLDRDNVKKLTTEQKELIKELRRLNQIANQFTKRTLSLKEFAAEVLANSEYTSQLRQIPLKAIGPRTSISKLYEKVRDFVQAVQSVFAGMFGYSIARNKKESMFLPYATAHIEAILKGKGYVAASPEFKSASVSFLPTEEEPENIRAAAESVREAMRKGTPSLTVKSVAKRTGDFLKAVFSGGQERIDVLKETFQNSRARLKRKQKDLEKSKLIQYIGDRANDFYNAVATSVGKAQFVSYARIEKPKQKLSRALKNYADYMGISMDKVVEDLGSYMTILHEPERRHMVYLMTVPLNKDTRVTFGNITDTPANIRQRLLELVISDQVVNLDPATRKQVEQGLKNSLESLVAGYTDKLGQAGDDQRRQSLDELADDYVVISSLNSTSIDASKTEFDALRQNATIRDLMDDIVTYTKELNDISNEILKEAGHWSPKLDAVVDFYGFENYFPFKIAPNQVNQKTAIQFDVGGARLGREGKAYYGSRLGGTSEVSSNNPLAQTYMDAGIAAAKFGSSEFLTKLRNAVRDGLIQEAKIEATYTFDQRWFNNGIDENLLKDRGSIYVYNPDGSMDVIKIKDPKFLQAVRKSYQEDSFAMGLANKLGAITSLIGQFHTRFNIKFAPYNYIRDVMTNAFVVAAEEDVGLATQFAGAAAKNLIDGDLFRIGFRFAKAWQEKDTKALERLAQTNTFARDMLDYVQSGGAVSVLQGIGAQRSLQQLQEEFKVIKTSIPTKEMLTKYFDIYMQMFEFSARVSAYTVIKPYFKDQFIQQGMSEADAETASMNRATAYVKGLTNFEEVGDLGKLLGDLYVFFRPAATGAVVALDAVGPAFRDWESVKAGLDKSIIENPDALQTYKETFFKQKRRATFTVMALVSAGGIMTWISQMMGSAGKDDDDDFVEEEDPSRWVRNFRFKLGTDKDTGKELVMQMPTGFGLGGFVALGSQMYLKALQGDRYKWGDFISNITRIGFDSFLPLPASQMDFTDSPIMWVLDTITPTVIRPAIHSISGVNAFGASILRGSRYIGSLGSPANVPAAYNDAADFIRDSSRGLVNFSPATLYFLSNNYADGVMRLFETGYDLFRIGSGDKDFDIDKDIPFIDSFISTRSYKTEIEYFELAQELKSLDDKLKEYAESNTDTYIKYTSDNPGVEDAVKIYNYFNTNVMNPLRKAKNDIIESRGTIPDREIQSQLRINRKAQREAMANFLRQHKELKELVESARD